MRDPSRVIPLGVNPVSRGSRNSTRDAPPPAGTSRSSIQPQLRSSLANTTVPRRGRNREGALDHPAKSAATSTRVFPVCVFINFSVPSLLVYVINDPSSERPPIPSKSCDIASCRTLTPVLTGTEPGLTDHKPMATATSTVPITISVARFVDRCRDSAVAMASADANRSAGSRRSARATGSLSGEETCRVARPAASFSACAARISTRVRPETGYAPVAK